MLAITVTHFKRPPFYEFRIPRGNRGGNEENDRNSRVVCIEPYKENDVRDQPIVEVVSEIGTAVSNDVQYMFVTE